MRPEEICSHYNSSIVVRRWAATWLDFLLFIGVIFALVSVAGEKHFDFAVIVCIVLIALYHPLLEGLTGKTFGKWICKLTIVDEFGNRPGVIKALVRTLFRLIEVNPLLMGGVPAGIAVLASPKKQRLGDMVAKTFVLQTEDLHYLTMPSTPAAYPPPYSLPTGAYPPPYPSPTAGAYPPAYPPSMAPPAQNGPAYDVTVPMTPPGPPLPYPPYQGANYPNYQPAPPPFFHPAPPPNLRSATPSKFKKVAFVTAGIFALLGFGLIFGSIIATNRTQSKRHPITLACGTFLKGPAQEGWYRLTNCNIDLTRSLFYTETAESGLSSVLSPEGTLTDVYVPVYASADAEDSAKTPLLLHTKDPDTLRIVDSLRKIDQKDEKALTKWVTAHLNELELRKDITGTIATETYQTNGSHDDLLKLSPEHLDPKFVIINAGDTPIDPKSIGFILLGVLCLIFGMIIGIVGFAGS